MHIKDNELWDLIDQMDEMTKEQYMNLCFSLIEKRRKRQDDIKAKETEDEPLTEDEIQQLNDPDDGFTPWEQARNDLGLKSILERICIEADNIKKFFCGPWLYHSRCHYRKDH